MIRAQWTELEVLLRDSAPTILRTLNPPLGDDGIAWLRAHGANGSVVDSYRAHDGANYSRVARGGGIMSMLPCPDGAPWAGVTRWLALDELRDETARLAGRVALDAGWVVVGRLHAKWKRSGSYATEHQRTIVAARTGQLYASEDWPETTERAGDERARLLPLGIDWEQHVAALVVGFRERGWKETLDDGAGTYLRIEAQISKTVSVATQPCRLLIELLQEREQLALDGEPSDHLFSQLTSALTKRSLTAQATAIIDAFDDAPEVEDYFFSRDQLEALLEQF